MFFAMEAPLVEPWNKGTSARCKPAHHVGSQYDFGKFSLQVRQGHGVDLLGGEMLAVNALAVVRPGGIPDQLCLEAEIARHAGGRFDAIVRRRADDHHRIDVARRKRASRSVPMNEEFTCLTITDSPDCSRTSSFTAKPGRSALNREAGLRDACRMWTTGARFARKSARISAMRSSASGLFR